MWRKTRTFEILDLETGQVETRQAKSVSELDDYLGKRINDVSVRMIRRGEKPSPPSEALLTILREL